MVVKPWPATERPENQMTGPRLSTKSTEEIPPGPETLESGPPENTPKYPENATKTAEPPKMPILGTFPVFWGYFLGVPEFQTRGILSALFVNIPGPAISSRWSKLGCFLDNGHFFRTSSEEPSEAVFERGPRCSPIIISSKRASCCIAGTLEHLSWAC